MRKISLFLGILTSTISVFGYSSADVSNAEFLAEQGVITSQSSAKWYRLDDTITRAEVIGIALKLKWITLPDSYYCKNYFSDVKYNANNNWICRAVELAADDGIISRANTKARPQVSITRAEALGVVINSRRLTVHDIPGYDDGIDAPFFDTEINWQRDAIMIGFFLNIIDWNSLIESEDRSNFAKFYFYPNRRATRAEVFSFARNILEYTLKNPLEQAKQTLSNKGNIFYSNKTYNYSFYYPSYISLELNNDDSPFTEVINELNNGFLIENVSTGTNGTSRSWSFSVMRVDSSIPFFEWYDLLENHYSYFNSCSENKVKSFEAFENSIWTTYWRIYFWSKDGCQGSQGNNIEGPVYYFKVASRNDVVIRLNQGQLSNEEFTIILDSFRFQ